MKNLSSMIAVSMFALLQTQAQAHVTLDVPETTAGASYKAIFKIGHGCEGASTHTVQITIPKGVVNVKPMPKAGWKLDTQTSNYDAPVQIYGNAVSSGVSQVTWSGGLLPNAHYDEFVLSTLVLPETHAQTYWKVTQLCDGKEAQARLDWVELPSEANPQPKRPAALLKVKPAKPVDPHAHH